MRPFLSNFQTLWFVQVVSFAESFLFSTEFVNKKWRTNKNLARRLVLHLMQVYCRYYATTKKCKKIFSLWYSMNLDEQIFFLLWRFSTKLASFWGQRSVTCLQRKECNWPKNLDCRSLTAKMDQPHLILRTRGSSCSKCDYSTTRSPKTRLGQGLERAGKTFRIKVFAKAYRLWNWKWWTQKEALQHCQETFS